MQNINKLGGLQEGPKRQREAELMNGTAGWCSCTDKLSMVAVGGLDKKMKPNWM